METEMKELIKLLPEGYEKACFETKAITRKRTIADPKDLLVLLLYYLYENHSLVDTSQFAFMCGIGNISDVAFMKRFLKCHDWIRWMIEHMLPAEIIHYQKPKELEPYRLLAVDASSITKKGAVQYSWHLHYAVDIFTLSCNQFLRTDQSVGESMENFDIEKGDLVLGDRAYGSIKSIRHCLEHGGDFILRIRNKAFQMYDENRNKIILSDWLKTVSSRAVDKKVYVKTAQKEWIPLRICAVRKSEEQIKKEEKRMKRQQQKSQKELSAETKFTRQYFFVITSLPESICAEKVLEFYRLRWQVELVFKRLKSILGLGSLPVKTEEAAETWIDGKMMVALLIEKYLGDIDFSPSGRTAEKQESVEGDETGVPAFSGHDISR